MLIVEMYFKFATSIGQHFYNGYFLVILWSRYERDDHSLYSTIEHPSLTPELREVFLVAGQIIVEDLAGGADICDVWIQ